MHPRITARRAVLAAKKLLGYLLAMEAAIEQEGPQEARTRPRKRPAISTSEAGRRGGVARARKLRELSPERIAEIASLGGQARAKKRKGQVEDLTIETEKSA